MQLEQQVISLDQARRLNELGFKRDSYYRYMYYWYTCPPYWWFENRKDTALEWRYLICESSYVNSICDWTDDFAAYTVSELMDILPDWIDWYRITIVKDLPRYIVSYSMELEWWYIEKHITKSTNLAIALWDMLLYLLENNLLSK